MIMLFRISTIANLLAEERVLRRKRPPGACGIELNFLRRSDSGIAFGKSLRQRSLLKTSAAGEDESVCFYTDPVALGIFHFNGRDG